jgi:ABC-type transport system involved in cytochrome c biogenesis permease component
MSERLPERPGAVLFAWWVVCRRDLQDLWVGGRALMLLLVYTVVIGATTFLMVKSSQMDMTPPKEMAWSILQTCMYVSVFMGLLVGADTLSGARDRDLMETLLLTPASRTQIVLGKFIASMSPWPAAMVVTFPCVFVVCQGDPILAPSLMWTALIGTMLIIGFTGLGMLVSFWSNANRTSLFISLSIYLLFLLPALLPGRAQKGLVGKFFQRSNPLAAGDQLLERLIVNNQTLHTYGDWLKGPIVFLVVVIVLLFVYAGPRLRLQAGGPGLGSSHWSDVEQLPATR